MRRNSAASQVTEMMASNVEVGASSSGRAETTQVSAIANLQHYYAWPILHEACVSSDMTRFMTTTLISR
jgi:hypothetical protein